MAKKGGETMGHKEVEVQRNVFNLTNREYHVWANNGELVDLTQDHFALPRVLRSGLVYIVNKEVYRKAKMNERPTDDLVLAEDYGRTTAGVSLTKLVMYDNKNIRVYPIKGV